MLPAMTLHTLEATFISFPFRPGHWRRLSRKTAAAGIFFLCPACYRANGGPVGTHGVICWEPRVPQSEVPGPGRWHMNGSSLDNLTLRASSSSVVVRGCPNGAHFFVRNGQIGGA